MLEIGNSPNTHWRYGTYAIRCLRTLVRRDSPLTREQIVYFLDKTHDDHPNIVSVELTHHVITFTDFSVSDM